MQIPRYLVSFDTTKLPSVSTDILIVGSGIAGLRAAIEASQYGQVILITKHNLSESNTLYAQGGIASHLGNRRLIKTHIADTLKSGQGLNDPKIVRQIIRKGIKNVRELIQWGVHFDKRGNKFDLVQEGGHHLPRILHAGGDETGKELLRVLIDKTQQIVNIEIKEKVFAIDILTARKNGCRGVLAYLPADLPVLRTQAGRLSPPDGPSGNKSLLVIQSRVTILTTGGIGQVYRETTNPEIATGDGISMAYRAGAVLQDMEFVQFHPTAFYVAGAARTLISEAVRGAGGILVDKNGKRFMTDYHPQGELAPRDIVSRCIVNQMRLTNDTSAYLDVTHLGAKKIKHRFPGLYQLCQDFGINITRDLIPVRPSTHYMIGGIRTKSDGSTNIRNLFAAGECAAIRFHGANRLGSNSLLEGLVIGAICGQTAGESLRVRPPNPLKIKYQMSHPQIHSINLEDVRNSLKSLMWRSVGIEREDKSLKEALRKIDFWGKYVLTTEFKKPIGWKLQNMLILARLITQAAKKRTESRGTHYRVDFPQPDNKHWKKHILISKFKNG